MTSRRVYTFVLLIGSLAAGCGSPAAPSDTGPSAVPTVATSATPTDEPTPAASPSPAATSTPQTLNREIVQPIDAGTYRLAIAGLPAMLITVPDGWSSGFGIYRPRPGYEEPAVAPVAVIFWDIDQVYGHPCQWRGTLFRPGPTVDDLAEALADIPLRNATRPLDLTLDGYRGKYLEWSVPADIETEPFGEYTSFAGCDVTADGDRAFESWTGRAGGSDRYQQAAGQVDRLWILDVDGIRVVIDAFEMPYATIAERAELTAVVESIEFER